MGSTTTRKGLYKPDISEINWGEEVNANFDILDKVILTDDTPGIQPANILENGSCEKWTVGDSSAPDNWTLTGTGAAIAKEATIKKIGSYSAKLTNDGTNFAILYQNVFDNYFKGRKVTFGKWIYASAANRVRIAIDDGVSVLTSSYHTGDSSWQFLSVTKTIDSAATKLDCQLRVETGSLISAYGDGAILVEGESAFAFVKHPADIASGVSINTAYVNLGSDISTTSTTFVSTGVSISLMVGPSGKAKIDASAFVYNSNDPDWMRLNRDSGSEYRSLGKGFPALYPSYRGASILFSGLSAGSHTFLIEWKVTSSTTHCRPATLGDNEFMRIVGMSW